MKFLKLFLFIVVGVMLLISVTMASTYNQGFIAAESGDYDSALKLWGPLAEQGDALAQFNLALLFHSGSGVAQNEAEAVHWYIKSAKNGYSKAQEFLVVAYLEGWFGLPKDLEKAAYWGQKLESNQNGT